eukprot:CAMPEP_0172505830 /NCGR_PEP_ID=MMETSP1066-20121228/189267_1 /TAXON_ID=671091 /ORGANISM="Coscinodiscus wailesii, Strain CCMP2513" /LENGTH=267 /DNA_ID=CAMNT_0013282577 /DNA_START=115 /DNA_END=918 /DNA_ORIENTATION=-
MSTTLSPSFRVSQRSLSSTSSDSTYQNQTYSSSRKKQRFRKIPKKKSSNNNNNSFGASLPTPTVITVRSPPSRKKKYDLDIASVYPPASSKMEITKNETMATPLIACDFKNTSAAVHPSNNGKENAASASALVQDKPHLFNDDNAEYSIISSMHHPPSPSLSNYHQFKIMCNIYSATQEVLTYSRHCIPLLSPILSVVEGSARAIILKVTNFELENVHDVLQPHIASFDETILDPVISGVVNAVSPIFENVGNFVGSILFGGWFRED